MRPLFLHRHLCSYVRVRVIAGKCKVVELKSEYIFHIGVQFHFRQWATIACKLQFSLLYVVAVQVHIAKGMYKIAKAQPAYLRYHHSKQRIAGYIKRHAQKHIGAALVQLAAKFTLAYIKLKHSMAGW